MTATATAAPTPTTTGTSKGTREQSPVPLRRRGLMKYWPQYVAIAPFYILFLVFGLFPIGFSIVLSFARWDGIGTFEWAGLAQYQFLISDPRFWNAVVTTLLIGVMSTVPMLAIALGLAFILHTRLRAKGWYRLAFFLPNVTSLVAMSIVFGSIFSNSFGLANAGLAALGAPTFGWLSDYWGIKITIALIVIWRFTGYNAIIYLAGLQSIPTELYESARTEGASSWQIFSRITVPLLRPVILFTVITSTIGSLSLFTEPQILFPVQTTAVGGPQEAGMTIVLYQYTQAFSQFDFGYGSAIAWALFLLSAGFAAVNFYLLRDRDAAAERRRVKKEAA